MAENFVVAAGNLSQLQNVGSLLLGGVGFRHNLSSDFFTTDLVKLVDRSQYGNATLGQFEFLQQPIENFAIIYANLETLKTDRPHQVVYHHPGFDIADDRRSADRVKIALHKLTIATGLRRFASPNFANMIPLERHSQIVVVLGDKTGQRHCQIEPHSDVTFPLVVELVHLFVGFVATFTGQYLTQFQNRCVDRRKSIRTIDRFCSVDQCLSRHHRRWKKVTKPFERSRFDYL